MPNDLPGLAIEERYLGYPLDTVHDDVALGIAIVDEDVLGTARIHIQVLVAMQAAHAIRVQNGDPVVPAKGNGPWTLPKGYRVVQKLEMQVLPLFLHPVEKQLRHTRVGLDIVEQQVVDRLETACLLA